MTVTEEDVQVAYDEQVRPKARIVRIHSKEDVNKILGMYALLP